MAEKLFPERHRCKKCSKGLGQTAQDPVYKGQFCSLRCASMAQPATKPDDAPRECKTQRDGKWAWKRRYRSEQEIPDRLRDDPSTSWYECGHCGHLHMGHSRMGEAEKFRMFEDPLVDIPDLLVKLRGHATHKDVAAAAGVRPIRIKELEEGLTHPEGLKTLAAVLRTYRVKLGVALPAAGRR